MDTGRLKDNGRLQSTDQERDWDNIEKHDFPSLKVIAVKVL